MEEQDDRQRAATRDREDVERNKALSRYDAHPGIAVSTDHQTVENQISDADRNALWLLPILQSWQFTNLALRQANTPTDASSTTQ